MSKCKVKVTTGKGLILKKASVKVVLATGKNVKIEVSVKKDGKYKEKVFVDGNLDFVLDDAFLMALPEKSVLEYQDAMEIGFLFRDLFEMLPTQEICIKEALFKKLEKNKYIVEEVAEVKPSKKLVMFQTIVDLQNDLNSATNGEDWTSGITNKGKEINWCRCMMQELAELVDSFPWKHWKSINKPANLANAVVEAVDNCHFLVSELLAEKANGNAEFMGKSVAEFLLAAYHSTTRFRVEDNDEIIRRAEVMSAIVAVRNSFGHEGQKFSLNEMTMAFFELTSSLGMTLENIFKLYIGKNALNSVRQMNGYKEGTYVKIWDGEEDNVFMQSLIETMDIEGVSIDAVVERLHSHYNANIFKPAATEAEVLYEITNIDALVESVNHITQKNYNKGHIKNRYKKLFKKPLVSPIKVVEAQAIFESFAPQK